MKAKFLVFVFCVEVIIYFYYIISMAETIIFVEESNLSDSVEVNNLQQFLE